MKKMIAICIGLIFFGFILRTCHRLFVCHKAWYAEGIRVQIDKAPGDSIWFNVEAVHGKYAWELISLDSNAWFSKMYYEETLGSYDIPSIDDFMNRRIRIGTKSDTIEILPSKVTYTDSGYLLFLPPIKIQHPQNGNPEFILDGKSKDQYTNQIWLTRIIENLKTILILASFIAALIAAYIMIIQYKWYLRALLKIQGRQRQNSIEPDICFSESEESALQEAKNIFDAEAILKKIFYNRSRRALIGALNLKKLLGKR